MMGEEIASVVLNGEGTMIEEVSDSNSSNHSSLASKHARCDSNICGSKFRGVVLHPNGHWGCQIYANHQRIWLGTFKSEKDAAMAYDSAALKLRNGDCHRNFPLTAVEEPKFQSLYSTEALLNMIKDGTYQFKFAEFVRTRSQSTTECSLKLNKARNNRRLTCKQLFQKDLTPSDVGKLNRLVIPKKYAVKFFSQTSEGFEENVGVNKVNDNGELAFYDRSMKLWKFRYCYWRSSQSYVFTRGWNRFVKEKQLKANETIAFGLSEYRDNAKVTQRYYMIDVLNDENSSLEPNHQRLPAAVMEMQAHVNQRTSNGNDLERSNLDGKGLMMEAKVRNLSGGRGFRLFGTEII